MHGCSTHRLGLNLNGSVHQPNSFLHAGKTEASTLHRRFTVESSS